MGKETYENINCDPFYNLRWEKDVHDEQSSQICKHLLEFWVNIQA